MVYGIEELLDMVIEAIESGDYSALPPANEPHGKCIEYRFEAFHDVKVYEDGYEEWFPIGD